MGQPTVLAFFDCSWRRGRLPAAAQELRCAIPEWSHPLSQRLRERSTQAKRQGRAEGGVVALTALKQGRKRPDLPRKGWRRRSLTHSDDQRD